MTTGPGPCNPPARRRRGRPPGVRNQAREVAPDHRLVLRPWFEPESCDAVFAARWASITPQTARAWSARHALGRRIGGRWRISRLAFAMWIENDLAALALYHAGDRSSPEVIRYWPRMQFPLGALDCGAIVKNSKN